MEGEIRMCQLGLSFLLDSKLFLNHGRLCMWTRVENRGRSLLARITIIQCSYVRDLALSLRFPTKSDLTFRWSTWNSLLESAVIHSIESRTRHARSNSKKFDSLLLAKGCQHICLPKSKHHSLGVPEKVIGDLDRNTRAVMADVNIPPMYWDIVVQHVALLNACTSPAVCDPSITIFEADKGVVPDLAVFPPPGCFCLRYRASRSQIGCVKWTWSIF
jgi:hypothetical protein